MATVNVNTSPVSVANLNYLQRANKGLADVPPFSTPQALSRCLFHITGIGINKQQAQARSNNKELPLPTEILLSALYGNRIPVAFMVSNRNHHVKIQIGTWSAAGGNGTASIERRQSILASALGSLYESIDIEPVQHDLFDFPNCGMALGVPSFTNPHSTEEPVALDRIIRALSDANWSFIILAEPVAESIVSQLRQTIIEEMRMVEVTSKSGQAPQALLEHYGDLLKFSLETFTSAINIGGWRTAVYLMGDEASYPRLASMWRGVFAGERSLPEPVRIWNAPEVVNFAREWFMPETPGTPPPGKYQRPLEFQTILTSKQLANCIHLPQLETVGFKVSTMPMFDVMPHNRPETGIISIGDVVLRTKRVDQPYTINKNELTRHTFISGVTGAGKTNTLFYLVTQLAAVQKVPFLVIEPAKTEYRSLLNESFLGNELQIFTLGNEQVAPLRLNPFEVLPGTPVGVHLDLLRSVFAASFGMWTPLPQILEKSLYEIYKDRGWDIANNKNIRVADGSPTAAAFPTLTDLAAKVQDVTKALGYDDKVTADLQAALLTRINSLRTGAKGLMLDVQQSVPMEALLEKPTIIELEGIGDDDDKAFLMGLILIRLVASRRSGPPQPGIRHVLVIEEAHRLLTNVSSQSRAEEANPRGKAVETFGHLLSEIRAFGQGVIISDQVPVKLAPDVIKNTNLKIMHRLMAADDRNALAGATAMSEKQSIGLSILEKGQAAVFSEGDDAPVLVKVPEVKSKLAAPSDAVVAEHMQEQFRKHPYLIPQNNSCSKQCALHPRLCQLAREIVADASFQQTFARAVLSAIHDTIALLRLWPDLVAYISPKISMPAEETPLMDAVLHHASAWFANKRGAQAVWSYKDTEQFATALRNALLAQLNGNIDGEPAAIFRDHARRQHIRQFNPFPACADICRQDPPLCLYRHAVADLIATGKFNAYWKESKALSLSNAPEEIKSTLWELCQDAGYELMEFATNAWPEAPREVNHAAARRASLCFGLHMFVRDPSLTPSAASRNIDQLTSFSAHNG